MSLFPSRACDAIDLRERRALELKVLMVRYQEGDSLAAEALVRLLRERLARYFRPHEEDLLQDCWLQIHRSRATYRPGEPVLPWVMGIARHLRIDSYRRRRRRLHREVDLDGVAEPAGDNPQRRWDCNISASRILERMRDLPEAQRNVLVMLKLRGMSVREVATATGATPGAVKQKAYRAYQTIRDIFGGISRY